MSTNNVQIVHQKCIELHKFVPIFLKFSGGPPDPLSLVLAKDVLKEITKIFILLKLALQVFGTTFSVKR